MIGGDVRKLQSYLLWRIRMGASNPVLWSLGRQVMFQPTPKLRVLLPFPQLKQQSVRRPESRACRTERNSRRERLVKSTSENKCRATVLADPCVAELGFTLIETSIAMVIMMVAGLGVISLFTYSIGYNSGGNDRAVAISIAQQQIEQLRR